ncbi:MAG: hypothetical protein AABY22_05265 [Nanoarchaeota archaeon]
MIVDKIKTYLTSKSKTFNQVILDDAYIRFKNSVMRQFMVNRDFKSGNIYTTLVTKPCARQSAYKYHGFEEEELPARTIFNFFIGDIVEMTVLMLAELAGVKITLNNEYLHVIREGEAVVCKPDGLFFDGKEYYNVEIKKMSDYTFNDFEKGILDDGWGYPAQYEMECEAWRQAKKPVEKTIFIGVKGLTGEFKEVIFKSDPKKLDSIFERIKKVKNSTKDVLPDRFYKPEIETYYKKKTGNLKLGIFCSYCSFKDRCWPDFKLEFTKNNYPIFRKPSPTKIEG